MWYPTNAEWVAEAQLRDRGHGVIELRAGSSLAEWLVAAGLVAPTVAAWYLWGATLVKAFWHAAKVVQSPLALIGLLLMMFICLGWTTVAIAFAWGAAKCQVFRLSPGVATHEKRVLCLRLKTRDITGVFCRAAIVESVAQRYRALSFPPRLEEVNAWFVCLLPATSDVRVIRVVPNLREAEARALQEAVARTTGAVKREVHQFESKVPRVWSTSLDAVAGRMQERLGGDRQKRPQWLPHPLAVAAPQFFSKLGALPEHRQRELAEMAVEFVVDEVSDDSMCLREGLMCVRNRVPAPAGLLWDLELLWYRSHDEGGGQTPARG